MPRRVKLPAALEALEEEPAPAAQEPAPATPPTPTMEPNITMSIEQEPEPEPEAPPEPSPDPPEAAPEPKLKRPQSEKQIAALAAAREKRAAMLREKRELEGKPAPVKAPIKEPKPPKEPKAPKAPKLAAEPKLPKVPKPRASKVTPAKVSAAESRQIADAKKMEFEARVARQVAHEMRRAKIIERLEAEEAAKAHVEPASQPELPQPGPSHFTKPVMIPKTHREFTIDGEAVFLRNRRKNDDWLDQLLVYAK